MTVNQSIVNSAYRSYSVKYDTNKVQILDKIYIHIRSRHTLTIPSPKVRNSKPIYLYQEP